ncbi:MAG TPA: class III extradiol ring-cleavage dioxygenase [Methylotenera sp.]
MNNSRLPTFFISHGGGPWPYIEDMRQRFAVTAAELKKLPSTLPAKPKAILMITGHWEAPQFTVSTSAHPPMEYDYYGFPEHTYHLQYPAHGNPELAKGVRDLLSACGIKSAEDPERGLDHGVFVPMMLMYPDADIPVVLLSMKSSYDPLEHIKLGEALAPLRDEGILIIGSGLTYHNMRGFGRPASLEPSVEFEQYLFVAISSNDPQQRNQALVDWEQAPFARLVHPREDHLIPLMVAAGAAGEDIGQRVFTDTVFDVVMASYQFG